jgi:hypothetical protein
MRPPKKTEAIALRVSPDEKAALKARAQAEGVTVSELIRRLIAAYLATSHSKAGPVPSRAWRLRMTQTLSSPFGWAGLAAGACALGLSWVGFAGSSSAQDLAVNVFASVTQGEASEAVRRTGRAEVALDYGSPVTIPIGSDEPGPDPRFAVIIQVDPGADGQAVITARMIQIALGGAETEIAAPTLAAAYGETARFQSTGSAWGDLEVSVAVTPEG